VWLPEAGALPVEREGRRHRGRNPVSALTGPQAARRGSPNRSRAAGDWRPPRPMPENRAVLRLSAALETAVVTGRSMTVTDVPPAVTPDRHGHAGTDGGPY